jgi:hypothetical protein
MSSSLILLVGHRLIEGLQELQLTDPQPSTDLDPTDPITVEKWKIVLRQHENRGQAYKNYRMRITSYLFIVAYALRIE